MKPEALDLGREAEALLTFLTNLLGEPEAFVQLLLRSWNAYQLAIATGLFLLAWAIRAAINSRFRAWMHAREGWPKWRLRVLVVVHRHLRMVLFLALIWVTFWVMREATWPSRSYLLGIIGNLSLAWLIVAFGTRLIANSLVRTVVRYGAWAWVTLHILGLTEEAQQLLDSIAVEFGEVRLSAWMLLQGVFLLAVLFFLARIVARQSTARLQASEDLSPAMQVLAAKFLQVALYGTAFFIGLRAVGVDLTGLAVLSGAIGVASASVCRRSFPISSQA